MWHLAHFGFPKIIARAIIITSIIYQNHPYGTSIVHYKSILLFITTSSIAFSFKTNWMFHKYIFLVQIHQPGFQKIPPTLMTATHKHKLPEFRCTYVRAIAGTCKARETIYNDCEWFKDSRALLFNASIWNLIITHKSLQNVTQWIIVNI